MLLITCDQVETVAKFLQSISGHLVSKRREKKEMTTGSTKKIIIMAMGSTRGHINCIISLVKFNFFDKGINKGLHQLYYFIGKVQFFRQRDQQGATAIVLFHF